jgi:hypothetical protein
MKPKNIPLNLLMIFLSFVLMDYGCNYNKPTSISKIEIRYVNPSIETFVSVSCSDFDTYFGNKEYKQKNIIDKQDLLEFENSLTNYKNDSSQEFVDVKAKIHIYYFNKPESILCTDIFGDFSLNGKYVGTSNNLKNFLKNKCQDFR